MADAPNVVPDLGHRPPNPGHRVSYISPSALTTYTEGCPRSWAFKGIARLPTVRGPAQEFGEAMHKEIETWLTSGQAPNQNTPEGRLATACIPHLPRPQTSDMYVEKEIFLAVGDTRMAPVLPDGICQCPCGAFFPIKSETCPQCGEVYTVTIGGKVDVLSPAVDQWPKVTDHKSCSRYPSGYELTTATLPSNPQGAMYGLFACDVYRTDAADLQWNYASKSQKTCTPVRATIARAATEAWVRRHLPVMREMTHFKKNLDRSPERVIQECHKVRADPGKCQSYNRMCDFSFQCDDFIFKKKATNQMAEMTLQEKLAMIKAKAQPTGEPIVPTNPAPNVNLVPATVVTPTPQAADQSVAVNPPEAAVALVETAAEIAGTAPAEPPAEPAKGKGRGKALPAAALAGDALARLKEIAKEMGCKITVEVLP